jgi:hypothetical protein
MPTRTEIYKGKEIKFIEDENEPAHLLIDGMTISITPYKESNLWAATHYFYDRFKSPEEIARRIIDRGLTNLHM